MNLDYLKSYDAEEREEILRQQLGEEKCKVIDKYELVANERLYWQRVQEKYPIQEYFSHKLAYKASVIGLIFHIHRLCFAKVKYFEDNWKDYQPCKYFWDRNGFVECELYDMEALRQKSTGIVIDLRDLARIKWLHEFKEMCDELERKKDQVDNQVSQHINLSDYNYVASRKDKAYSIGMAY